MGRFISEYYVRPIAEAIRHPGLYFSCTHQHESRSIIKGLILVVGSSLISAIGFTLISIKIKPMIAYLVFFTNNVGMVLISSGLGYLFAKMISRQSISVITVFNIYAMSFAVTLLFSWIPNSIYVTEPWKWWIIGTGWINGIGIEFRRALAIILLSVIVMIGFFWIFLKIT